jgi:hypothetical protein
VANVITVYEGSPGISSFIYKKYIFLTVKSTRFVLDKVQVIQSVSVYIRSGLVWSGLVNIALKMSVYECETVAFRYFIVYSCFSIRCGFSCIHTHILIYLRTYIFIYLLAYAFNFYTLT